MLQENVLQLALPSAEEAREILGGKLRDAKPDAVSNWYQPILYKGFP